MYYVKRLFIYTYIHLQMYIDIYYLEVYKYTGL